MIPGIFLVGSVGAVETKKGRPFMMNNTVSMAEFVRAVDGHPDIVGKVPDELGLSLPVPAFSAADASTGIPIAFFYYSMKGFPPGPFRISVPKYRAIVQRETGKIVSFTPVQAKDFGINWPPDKPAGEYTPPKGLTMDDYRAKQDRFYILYDMVLPLYIAGGMGMSEAKIRETVEFARLFNELAHRALHPFYRALNPQFFQWLGQFGVAFD
jgi:hypothetical protein